MIYRYYEDNLPDLPERQTGHDAREKRFAVWYKWKPYRGKGAICPLRVAGKHCRRYSRMGERCVCDSLGLPDILDHVALWKDKDGKLIFTTEPYGLSTDALSTFTEKLKSFGLAVEVLPYSGWYPNRTILVAVYLPEKR